MSKKRRKCVLSDPNNRKVDLRQFEKIIIDTINETVPGKNPQVFKDHFSTDCLSRGEAILIGRALSKLSQLSRFGKTVTTFRLFDGKDYDPDEETESTAKKQVKGGRMQ